MNNPNFTPEQDSFITDEMRKHTLKVMERVRESSSKYARIAGTSQAMLVLALMVLDGEMSKEELSPEFWETSRKLANGTWGEEE